MARLRLFAAARQAAGMAQLEVEAATVAGVLSRARETFGKDFSAVLAGCRIWVNGKPATPSTRVSNSDEVAVLPPVSGGA